MSEAPENAAVPSLDLEEMERDEALLPPAPWELWTSSSFRRITGPDGKIGGVLHAYNQRGDGHPDLSMPEDQLFALVRLRNALPALLARIRELEEGVKAVLARDAEWAPSGQPNDCNCINLSRAGEREYETGTCPHQKLRALLNQGGEHG
jgi:hypothetical protein